MASNFYAQASMVQKRVHVNPKIDFFQPRRYVYLSRKQKQDSFVLKFCILSSVGPLCILKIINRKPQFCASEKQPFEALQQPQRHQQLLYVKYCNTLDYV